MDEFDESEDEIHNLLSFRPSADTTGLTIVDHVERRQCTLHTPNEVDPSEAPLEKFYFPVDRGVVINSTHLSLPHKVGVYVRNHAGIMVNELTEGDSNSFPHDLYSVELSSSIKLYLTFENAFSVEVSKFSVNVNFDTDTEIHVGARSHHESPAGTITTSAEPNDIMAAISHFGSALKTTSAERSYPTLRGHPPTIELGDKLRIPRVIDRPSTGIRIILPPDYYPIYIASPLAYYLGATVKPGNEARIETELGFTHSFGNSNVNFEQEVGQILKQIFFLDCIVRTQGYYPVELFERNKLEDQIDADFGELYNKNIAEQLESYLKIPFSKIEPFLPKWKLTAHTTLQKEHVELLPFLVNDLAIIRKGSISESGSKINISSHSHYVRKGDIIRYTARSDRDSAKTPLLIELDETNSLEQTWIGSGAPLGASKAMIEAFRNRLNRDPTNGNIDITVICNDSNMEEERDIVNEIYGSREELPFQVRGHYELTTNQLERILEEDTDFLHYIGHIDAEGFECPDGRFDASNLQQTGADAFFLNACTSYQQGKYLIKAGSAAGVVTLQDVINSGAERVGKSLARLLNRGFPLRAALNIAKTQSIMGGHYLVIGDGNIDVAQTTSGIPALYDIDKIDDNTFNIIYRTYPTRHKSMGSLVLPHVTGNDQYYLASGDAGSYTLDKSELQELFSKEVLPILTNRNLVWSDDPNVFDKILS